MSIFTPQYLKGHITSHMAGGVIRWTVWMLVFGKPGIALLLTLYNQVDWERMQQEYSNEYGHVYPWLSVIFDTGMTLVGALLAMGGWEWLRQS